METTAEVKIDQTAKRSDTIIKTCSADVKEARMMLTKNIMFPSLSDDMLLKLKIVDVRCHGDASKQQFR